MARPFGTGEMTKGNFPQRASQENNRVIGDRHSLAIGIPAC